MGNKFKIDERIYTMHSAAGPETIKEFAGFFKSSIIEKQSPDYWVLWVKRKEMNRKPTAKERREYFEKAYNRAEFAREILYYNPNTKWLKEGVHFKTLAYTDYADELVPSVVKWKTGVVDSFDNKSKTMREINKIKR